jgi:hypothetical protein
MPGIARQSASHPVPTSDEIPRPVQKVSKHPIFQRNIFDRIGRQVSKQKNIIIDTISFAPFPTIHPIRPQPAHPFLCGHSQRLVPSLHRRVTPDSSSPTKSVEHPSSLLCSRRQVWAAIPGRLSKSVMHDRIREVSAFGRCVIAVNGEQRFARMVRRHVPSWWGVSHRKVDRKIFETGSRRV